VRAVTAATPATELVAAPGRRGSARGFAIVTAVFALFLAAAAAPSPLYALYASRFGFSAATLTVVFAVYVVALLVTLLVAGSLSDAVGRRPVIVGALVLQSIAMLLFLLADSLIWLYAARVVQGVATGLVTAAVAATLLELQPAECPGLGATVNAVTPSLALAAGAVGAGALVQHAPYPLRLVYLVLLVGFVLLTAAMGLVPEPVATRRRPDLSLRLSVPAHVRAPFLATLPCLVATWALGGFFLSLGPSLVLALEHSTDRLLGGSVIGVLCATGGVSSMVVRAWQPRLTMVAGCVALVVGDAVCVAGIAAGSVVAVYAGTFVAGTGFGAAFLGAFRTLAGLAGAAERGALIASMYVASYVAFSVPAVLAGLATTHVGVRRTAVVYGCAVAALAGIALVTTGRRRPETGPPHGGRPAR
jgi:MFS family permease